MDPAELQRFFERNSTLESAYLSHDEPWRQSGMSGPLERWVSLRKPVADAIDRDGAFLDIGCANGFLLECCLAWTAERGIHIDPYGLDISGRLLELAKARLPQYADHFYCGNAYEWTPPMRFDFVRTELVYVPADYERDFVERIFDRYLKPDGRLLVANYAEGLAHPERGVFPENFPASDLLARLADLRLQPVGIRDGYDPVKDRRIRIVILDRSSLMEN